MKNIFKSSFLFLLFSLSVSCQEDSIKIINSVENTKVLNSDGDVYTDLKILKNEDRYVQEYNIDGGKLKLTYKESSGNSVLVTSEFYPFSSMDSLSINFQFFSLDSSEIIYRYCLPFSLPYLRADSLNIIPKRYISNKETFNNTFSLITNGKTYSVSIFPPDFRMNKSRDTLSMNDYSVSFYDNNGSIVIRSNHNQKIKSGEKIVREFLISISDNNASGYPSGYHVGEYMNEINYVQTDNLINIYRKSMSYLLGNDCAFGKINVGKHNYYGAVHTQTGQPYGNGDAVYAMYGNSFSVAALNQYLKINSNNNQAKIRLDGVNDFLLNSDVLTENGAYWSMLDLLNNKGYVDQAYRKWIETHATGWITYYLLNAYEISKDKKYEDILKKTLVWMADQQDSNGRFPKYYENGKPSSEDLGDIAWVVLSFFKAHELNIDLPNIDFKGKALLSIQWMENNMLAQKQYYGSFEDVGGVNDSYCPSVSSRAFIAAYKSTKDKRYLNIAKDILSVSLSWITTDYTEDDMFTWADKYRIQPAFAQVESTSCYWPCSYTLPMMYLACSEVSSLVNTKGEKDYWLGISKNFNHISDFMLSNSETKCKYGMEWLLAPFLVFSEWGNMQLCWSIIETLRNRITSKLPDFVLCADMKANYKGKSYKLYMPEWKEYDRVILPIDGVEPVLFKDENNDISVILLGESSKHNIKLYFNNVSNIFKSGQYEIRSLISNKVIGVVNSDLIEAGINLSFSDIEFVIFKHIAN